MDDPGSGDADVYDRRQNLVPWGGRRSSARSSKRRSSIVFEEAADGKKVQWWKFTLRDWDDEDEQDWWFASTAIPLLAATLGPLANVLSIAALVTFWRQCSVPDVSQKLAAECAFFGNPDTLVSDLNGVPFADPQWCYWMNVVSLIVGFIGNFFLLCNFTNRVRYIVALPATIALWYVATGILMGITVAMEVYVPPHRPEQTYTQGFWYAVLAACLYLICSMLLMVNMLGYFLGHYPQNFTLTESHRTLILQTMLFFTWLAVGAEIIYVVESKYGKPDQFWNYTNALYFCDVTILTVGFGDMYPTSNIGRGIMFPYAIGGIIMLGLTVSSIARFAGQLGSENIVQGHIERSRARTVGRTVTSSMELERRRAFKDGERPEISAPFSPVDRTATIRILDDKSNEKNRPSNRSNQPLMKLTRAASYLVSKPRKSKLILLREEKDRFEAMRRIQGDTERFKNWTSLCFSILSFGILWNCGAAVFWICERKGQDMTYFQALYFCYVSLLTIGYGDLAPKSNPGRPFFVVWSLVAVPTMTILVSHLGNTVINSFKKGTLRVADFTLLPKQGVYRSFLSHNPWLLNWLVGRKERKAAQRRLEEGFQVGAEDEDDRKPKTIEKLAAEHFSHYELARRLAKAIRSVAIDAKEDSTKRYSYEEWVEFTQLIRFTAKGDDDTTVDEEEGMIEWDWIGEDSPMLTKGSEADFVLDRLCESMNRYVRRLATAPYKLPDSPMEIIRPLSSGPLQRLPWKRPSEGGSGVNGSRDEQRGALGFDPDDSGSVSGDPIPRHATYVDED